MLKDRDKKIGNRKMGKTGMAGWVKCGHVDRLVAANQRKPGERKMEERKMSERKMRERKMEERKIGRKNLSAYSAGSSFGAAIRRP
jgi:hypothetical protein